MTNLKISFSSVLYKEESIDEAIEDFRDFCEFEKKREGNAINITLSHIKQDIDAKRLADEFSNYVLGLMKNNALV